MKIELWKAVPGYEGLYEVNKLSDIRSLHKRNYGNLIAKRIDNNGYYNVKLSKNGKQKTINLHRIVAEAFVAIPNLTEKLQVNHIDCNKLNNHYSNLEWCTQKENVQHAFRNIPISRKKRGVIDTCTGREYSCVKEAAFILKMNHHTLRNMLTGNIKNNRTCLEFISKAA